MVKVENLVTPSPEWWEVAIKGMRNSYKATDKSDSKFKVTFEVTREDCLKCTNYHSGKCHGTPDNLYLCGLILGENDQQLLLKLCKAGTSHRKVLRQLPVIMDITAPLYFWKQMDCYSVGTTMNSESTMHCLTKEPFKLEDFSMKQEYLSQSGSLSIETYNFSEITITLLNNLREMYLETGDMEYWNKINEYLPQSYNQKRTWSANYEVLVNIIQQRRGHKLKEWDDFIDYLLENVPYLKEIVEAVDG